MSIIPNRRSVLAYSLIASAGLLAGCKNAKTHKAEEIDAKPYAGKLGAQLYTVRSLFEKDYAATLNALADIGFKDCETAGFYNHNPADVRKALDDVGMVSRSAHVQLDDMRNNFDMLLEQAETMGQSSLFISWIAEKERTLDGYRAIADLLNERALEAKKAGKTVGYHNHEFEFLKQGEISGYDILLERTDPKLVAMEIDIFWAHKVNIDPLNLFKKAPGRFKSCHIKDIDSNGEMADVGDGEINFASILSKYKEAGIEQFYVEHDNAAQPLVSLSKGFNHLMR